MKRQTLLLVTLSALLLAACNNSYSTIKSSELNSATSEETSSSTSELPDAPLDQIRMTAENFHYNDDISVPVIHGLDSRGIRAKYTYHDIDTKEYIDIYDAGKKNYIEIGTYLLKADITCFSYKPFSLTTTFSVLPGEMTLTLEAHDYYYDEEIPNPWLYGEPYSAEVTYKYYSDPNDKQEFNYRVPNTIVPGEYTLEATATDDHFITAVTTDTFMVFKAEFDERYELTNNKINIGELDTGFNQDDIDLDNLLSIRDKDIDDLVTGVHFSFDGTYDFNYSPTYVTVVAQKEHFEDKEYTIELSFSKKVVAMPHLEYINDDCAIDNIVYDGTVKSVKFVNYDERRIEMKYGPLSAIDASAYRVEIALRDPVHTCWPDGSADNVLFEWRILPRTLDNYRLRLNDFICPENSTEFRVPYSVLDEPMDVILEYKDDNGDWVNFEYQYLLPIESGLDVRHYDENGKLIVDNKDQITSLSIGTTNYNYYVGLTFKIHPYEIRQVKYTIDNRAPLWDELWPIFIDYGTCTEGSDEYILQATTDGSYFTFLATMDRIMFMEMTLKAIPNMEAFSVKAILDSNSEDNPTIYERAVDVPAGFDGSKLVFDFSDVFEEMGGTYFFVKFVFSGETLQYLQMTELLIQHMRSV